MSPLAKQIAGLADALPEDKARALAEYAQYLADKADSEEWDRKFGDARYATKLKALMAEVEREIAEGKAQPLDPDLL